MKTTKLINRVADRSHVTRSWLKDEFEMELEDIALATTPEEREAAVTHMSNVIDEQIRRLNKVRDEMLIAAVEVFYE